MSIWVWCPAYPLADVPATELALTAAATFAAAVGETAVASPLIDRHPGVGAWLPAPDRQADLEAGRAHGWLLAARGGYGCIDLLGGLRRPLPPVIGYSDLTVLHAAQVVLGGPEGIYGFMPGVRHGTRAIASAAALVRGEAWSLKGHDGILVPGRADGELFAGCLRVLAGLVGTPWMPRLRGRILALEDVDERPYQVGRDLWQLHAAGALDGVAGLLFGRFPATNPEGYAGPNTAQICAAWARRLGIPALFGLPFGHDADPLALGQGRATHVDLRDDGWVVAQDTFTTRVVFG